MIVWKWFSVVIALTSVSGEVRADLPLVGRVSAGSTDRPRSNLSLLENGSSDGDEALSNPLDELIGQTGIWKESSGVDSVQNDTRAEPINQTGNGYPSVTDTIKDDAPSEPEENAVHNVSKNYSAPQRFHQLIELFSIPQSRLESVFERTKWSNDGVDNPSQEHLGSNSRKVKPTDGNVKNSSQVPIGFNDPFQPVKDALYQYAEQMTKQEIKQGGSKKAIPLTLADLNKLSDDEIRDLSYHYIPVEEHAKFMYQEMLENMKKPFVDRTSRAKIDGFWKWFKSSYVPKHIDHINVQALADANWFGIRKLRDAFNTNQNDDLEEDLGFFERLLAFFKIG